MTNTFCIASNEVDGYVTVPPLVDPPKAKLKGQRCGECGVCFDYGKAYLTSCARVKCPMGFGATELRLPGPT